LLRVRERFSGWRRGAVRYGGREVSRLLDEYDSALRELEDNLSFAATGAVRPRKSSLRGLATRGTWCVLSVQLHASDSPLAPSRRLCTAVLYAPVRAGCTRLADETTQLADRRLQGETKSTLLQQLSSRLTQWYVPTYSSACSGRASRQTTHSPSCSCACYWRAGRQTTFLPEHQNYSSCAGKCKTCLLVGRGLHVSARATAAGACAHLARSRGWIPRLRGQCPCPVLLRCGLTCHLGYRGTSRAVKPWGFEQHCTWGRYRGADFRVGKATPAFAALE
jgi:hypothetical protein